MEEKEADIKPLVIKYHVSYGTFVIILIPNMVCTVVCIFCKTYVAKYCSSSEYVVFKLTLV